MTHPTERALCLVFFIKVLRSDISVSFTVCFIDDFSKSSFTYLLIDLALMES